MTPPKIIGTLESALYASDLKAAAHFWGQVMGLPEIARVPDRHIFFRCGPQVLLVFNPAVTREPPRPGARLPVPPHGTEGAGHFCIAAQNLQEWRDHLEASGIVIEADFIWPQGGRSIYFRDPAGNSIEIAEPKIWS